MAENQMKMALRLIPGYTGLGFGVVGQDGQTVDPCSSRPVVSPRSSNTRRKIKLPRLKPGVCAVFSLDFESERRKAAGDSCSDFRLHPSAAKFKEVALAGGREKGGRAFP